MTRSPVMTRTAREAAGPSARSSIARAACSPRKTWRTLVTDSASRAARQHAQSAPPQRHSAPVPVPRRRRTPCCVHWRDGDPGDPNITSHGGLSTPSGGACQAALRGSTHPGLCAPPRPCLGCASEAPLMLLDSTAFCAPRHDPDTKVAVRHDAVQRVRPAQR